MDVIHSFFLPNFRFKQDAVPGLTIPFWFTPNKISAGRLPVPDRNGNPKAVKYWDIVCAELCGISHTDMAAQLYVVSDADFAKWLKDGSSVPGLPAWTVWNKDNPMQSQDKVWTRWEWQDKKFDTSDPTNNKRVIMGPAKVKREPFGVDQKPGGEAQPEDM